MLAVIQTPRHSCTLLAHARSCDTHEGKSAKWQHEDPRASTNTKVSTRTWRKHGGTDTLTNVGMRRCFQATKRTLSVTPEALLVRCPTALDDSILGRRLQNAIAKNCSEAAWTGRAFEASCMGSPFETRQ